MATKWQNIYVFISSTFNDMHAERDYLVKRVFPELQEWCERRNLRLVDIDLRWGVTEQDATHNKNVVNVCLRRIDECRPFFLCFLGQRYGWIPASEDVSADTYNKYPRASEFVGKVSVTELEILHALVSPLHGEGREHDKPDWHYLPAQYSYFYFREPSYLSHLPVNPPRLRETYTDAADSQSPLDVLKNERIPATGRPLRRYHAVWKSDEVDQTPELALPLVCPSSLSVNIERWRKEWKRCADIDVEGTMIPEEGPIAERARSFNAALTRGRLGDFRVENDQEAFSLGELIVNDLKEAIIQRYPDHAEAAVDDDLQCEIDQHDEFLFSRGQGYIERSGVFDELDAYLQRTDDHRLFVLTAEGGMGKSALLARWLDRSMNGSYAQATGTTFHYRFIGASDQSSSVDALLRMLLREWRDLHGKFYEELPESAEKLRLAWPRLLKASGHSGKFVLVLDGLNQLQSGLRDLEWLPEQLPEGVKIVVSFRRGDPAAETLYKKYASAGRVVLSSVSPFDREEDRRRLIDAYLWQYLKQLDEPAIRELLSFPGGRNPLFLKVVLSELRVFGAFAGLHERIHGAFGDNPETAFEGTLRRLETDPAYTSLDAAHAVRLLFGFLSHARYGLTSDELTDLLLRYYPWSSDAATSDRVQQIRDAVYLYLRQVRPFLARREGRHDFFYESFKIAAARRYSTGPLDWHKCLAEHFERRARTPLKDVVQTCYDVRVIFDVEAALQDRLLESLSTGLLSQSDEGESPDESGGNLTQMLLELQQPFLEILSLDRSASANLIVELHEHGSAIVAQRLPRDRAEVLAAQFAARGIDAHLEAAASEVRAGWYSSDPHPYSEMLYHQVEARQWHAHVQVLSDNDFRIRCMRFFGPSFFIDYFHDFVRVGEVDATAREFVNELRLRMPINEYTQPLLAVLTGGLHQNPEEAANFLLACAKAPVEQARAIIPLRAMEEPTFDSRDEQSLAVRQAFDQALPLLLASSDKTVRWHTAHLYWTLAQAGASTLLVQTAEDESEHPLVRAEAARQLGEVDDPEVAERLQRLSTSPLYPLNEMAARSARLIQQSLRLTEPAPIDDWYQPEELPGDLTELLKSLGVNPQCVDLASYGVHSRLLVHMVLSSSMSVDTRWKEVETLHKVFRATPIHLVCSEAGGRDCSLTPIKQVAGNEIWRRIALRYFHDFKLGSEEYLQLVSEYRFVIQGVDDMEMFMKAMDAKQKGMQALDLAASVIRARAMLTNTLNKMTDTGAKVAVLITQELPGYQISRLLGADNQYDSQIAIETGGSDGTLMGNSFIEALLPDHVTPDMVHKPENLTYVMVRMPDPPGDTFGMDINYIHSIAGSLGKPIEKRGSEKPVASPAPYQPPPRDLRGADLCRSEMVRARLHRADLTGASLEEAHLRGANLAAAILEQASLRRANLFMAKLNDANLVGADLVQANLHGASLNAANLKGAKLVETILIGASLQTANLEYADLTGADLREADLKGACLTGAMLSGVKLTGAKFDTKTAWPDDFSACGQGLILTDPPLTLDVPVGGEEGMEAAILAVIAYEQGKNVRGSQLQSVAITLWERQFGAHSRNLAISLNSLLRALQDRGHHSIALPLCVRAVQIWDTQPTLDSAWLAIALNNLGLSLFKLEELEAAEQQLLRSARTNPQSPSPYYWLAKVYQSRGLEQDIEREFGAWSRYLDLGPTTEQRAMEATKRLAEING